MAKANINQCLKYYEWPCSKTFTSTPTHWPLFHFNSLRPHVNVYTCTLQQSTDKSLQICKQEKQKVHRHERQQHRSPSSMGSSHSHSLFSATNYSASLFLYHQLLLLLLLKGGRGIFNVCNHLTICYVNEGEAGTDVSAQMSISKNWKMHQGLNHHHSALNQSKALGWPTMNPHTTVILQLKLVCIKCAKPMV